MRWWDHVVGVVTRAMAYGLLCLLSLFGGLMLLVWTWRLLDWLDATIGLPRP